LQEKTKGKSQLLLLTGACQQEPEKKKKKKEKGVVLTPNRTFYEQEERGKRPKEGKGVRHRFLYREDWKS